MSALTDKYGGVYTFAESLGCTGMNAAEDNNHMTISGTCPTQYIANEIWDKIKEIDPQLSHGDLTMNLSVARTDIHGEYEVKSGDALSGIAKKVTHGKLSYQQIFEANRDILSDPNKIHPGQKLKIPNFS